MNRVVPPNGNIPPIPQIMLFLKLLYLYAHVYVSVCFMSMCPLKKRARVAGSRAFYGPQCPPGKKNQPAPPRVCLHGASHHFFFQNFNRDTQLKITRHYYPNLEPNITAKQ